MFEVQRRRGTSDVTIRTVRPALIRKVTLLEIVHLLHIHPFSTRFTGNSGRRISRSKRSRTNSHPRSRSRWIFTHAAHSFLSVGISSVLGYFVDNLRVEEKPRIKPNRANWVSIKILCKLQTSQHRNHSLQREKIDYSGCQHASQLSNKL